MFLYSRSSPLNTYAMQKTLSDLEEVQLLIRSKWLEYRVLIQNNRPFEQVKAIYLHIKELEKEADALMQRANQLHLGENRKSNQQ